MRAAISIAALGLAAAAWCAGTPATAPGAHRAAGNLTSQPVRAAQATRPDAGTGTVDAARAAASASAPASVAKVEAAVREARRNGKGEQEVHRLRATQLPAAQVEELARMEAAEAAWQRRLEALQAACAARLGCGDARASFTSAELQRVAAYAAPALRQD